MEINPYARLIRTEEVAERLNVHPSTVRRWRLDGVGPRFLRIGKLYRYPSADLEAWIAESIRGSISS